VLLSVAAELGDGLGCGEGDAALLGLGAGADFTVSFAARLAKDAADGCNAASVAVFETGAAFDSGCAMLLPALGE
jgi:hypothetical protein